jgi:chromosome segregation ATPase
MPQKPEPRSEPKSTEISLPEPKEEQVQPMEEDIIPDEIISRPPKLKFKDTSQFESIGRSFSSRPISFHTKRLKNHMENIREELMGAESPTRDVPDDYEANDTEMKTEEEEQEQLADDIHKIAQDFKNRLAATTTLLSSDNDVIDQGAKVLEKNISALGKTDNTLKKHQKTISMNLFTTLNMIVMVFVVFISMMAVIKIFPKR